jgi:type II secretory pathway pseudopilin PulG
LIELLVVMVILIALAGVLVPMLPNMLTRSHDSSVVTNITEAEKSIGGFFTVNLAYPDQFDSCMDTNGNIYQGMIWATNNPNGWSALTFTPVTGSGVPTANGTTAFVAGTLAAGEDTSLKFAGINNLWALNPATDIAAPGGESATFNAYINSASNLVAAMNPVTAGMPVVIADPNYIYQKLNAPLVYGSTNTTVAGRYVVFTLGEKCTIIGATSYGMYQAPLSFGEHQSEAPNNSYARLLCVFRVFADGTRAQLVGTAHSDATGLGTYDMHMQEFYSIGP